MPTKQKETETVTVEGRALPRPLTDQEKQASSLFVVGHPVREPIHDTGGKEVISPVGETSTTITKTRLRAPEIPALAIELSLINRLNKKQQFCPRCNRLGIPTIKTVDTKGAPAWSDIEFSCTHDVVITESTYVEVEKEKEVEVDVTIQGRWAWSKDKTFKQKQKIPARYEWQDKVTKKKETISWKPYYWDSLTIALNRLLEGRMSLDGKSIEAYIKYHEGTQTREKIEREVGPPSAGQPVS